MSRSRRHTPIGSGSHHASEKYDKRIQHGRWRAAARTALSSGNDERAGYDLPADRDNWSKDGKRWLVPGPVYQSWGNDDEAEADLIWLKQVMRK